jgi:hypothetical protein
VAVAAHQSGAGQREALFGADDVDDALLGGDRVDIGGCRIRRVAAQRVELVRAFRIGDRNAMAGASTRGVVGRL